MLDCSWGSDSSSLQVVGHRFIIYNKDITNLINTSDKHCNITGIRLWFKQDEDSDVEIKNLHPSEYQINNTLCSGSVRHVYSADKQSVALIFESRLTDFSLQLSENDHQNILTNCTRNLLNMIPGDDCCLKA